MYTLYLTSYRALLNTPNAFLLPSLMGLLWFASTSSSLWGSHPEDGSESPNFRLALPSYTNTNYFLAEHIFFSIFFLRILNTKESSAITSVPPGKAPKAHWVSSPGTFHRFYRLQHAAQHKYRWCRCIHGRLLICSAPFSSQVINTLSDSACLYSCCKCQDPVEFFFFKKIVISFIHIVFHVGCNEIGSYPSSISPSTSPCVSPYTSSLQHLVFSFSGSPLNPITTAYICTAMGPLARAWVLWVAKSSKKNNCVSLSNYPLPTAP